MKNYFKILEVISFLNIVLNTDVRDGKKFKIYDLKIITLSLPSEFMSIDIENLFFVVPNGKNFNLIERSQCNK